MTPIYMYLFDLILTRQRLVFLFLKFCTLQNSLLLVRGHAAWEWVWTSKNSSVFVPALRRMLYNVCKMRSRLVISVKH